MSIFGEFAEDVGEVVSDVTGTVTEVVSDVGSAAGEALEEAGEFLGLGTDSESELGETDDPTELLHGNQATIEETISHLRDFASAFGRTATALSRIDIGDWRGEAADAFREAFGQSPRQWSDAAHACDDAARAWDGYLATLRWAQQQARVALDLYHEGNADSERASAAYNDAVTRHNQAVDAANAGQGAPPPALAPFSDPGEAKRSEAREILARARSQRDSAAEQAITAIQAATELAPPLPSLADRAGIALADGFDMAGDALASFTGGVLEVGEETLLFARSVMPFDLYNLTHPAEYLSNVTNAAAGLVHGFTHPVELAKEVMGSGWTEDPVKALGKLAANVFGEKGLGALSKVDDLADAGRLAPDGETTNGHWDRGLGDESDHQPRHYDDDGNTIRADELTHPHAELLDRNLLERAKEVETRQDDALTAGVDRSHPEVRELIEEDYDPSGGMGTERWNKEFWPTGGYDAHGNRELYGRITRHTLKGSRILNRGDQLSWRPGPLSIDSALDSAASLHHPTLLTRNAPYHRTTWTWATTVIGSYGPYQYGRDRLRRRWANPAEENNSTCPKRLLTS